MSSPGLNPYVGANPVRRRRRAVWREIARYVARDVPGVHRAVELGAGHCDFINAFPANVKLAFDLDPDMLAYAAPEVTLRIESALTLSGVEPGSMDLVFASDLLAHLQQHELDQLLPRIRESLSEEGRFVLVQPNHRLCADHYFDAPTRVTVFSDLNLPSYMQRHGLAVRKLVSGLLPLSINSRLTRSALLTRLYLASPIKPLAAQMYAIMGKV